VNNDLKNFVSEVSMQANEIMTRGVECIPPEMAIRNAARRMKALDIGFLPVCENDRLIGTITDRDIVLRVVADERDVDSCMAREIMTGDVYWCYEDQTAEEVAEYMSRREVRRVLVLDRNKRLTGVISIGDLAKGGEEQKTGEAIREIAEAPRQAA
jgi:CBS domain-containing protein